MKKIFSLTVLAVAFSCALTACAPTDYPDIIYFTKKLNSLTGEQLELSDYRLYSHEYKYIFEKDGACALLVAEENENGKIKKVRLSLSKADENSQIKAITGSEAEFYKEKVCQILSAFTLFEKEKSRGLTEKILPSKSEDFSKTGEYTLDEENYHLVYYSNKICCQFTVTNTYLEKTESTEKPVSRPLYEVTANVVA